MPSPNFSRIELLPALVFSSARLPPSSQNKLIVDCTNMPRFGLRGPGSCSWLAEQGFDVPDTINRAEVNASGGLCLRLGKNEAMISGFRGMADLERRWTAATGAKGYDAFRRDSWSHFLISGSDATEVMALFTGIDLREDKMPVGMVAQTRALHLDAVIVRTDRPGTPAFEMFFDITSSAYAADLMRRLASDYEMCSLPDPS